MQTIEQENAKLTRAGYPPLADCEPLHTPGPWRLAWGKIVDQSDKAVCLLTPRKGAMNAHLIAAAPELLSALQEMMSVFQDHEQYDEESAEVVSIARAAIAKAEGRAE